MKVFSKPQIISLVTFLAFSFFFVSCSRKSKSPFSDRDADVKENIENLMGLSVGMTKQQVFGLSGVSNYVKGMTGEVSGFIKFVREVRMTDPLQTKILSSCICPLFLTTLTELWATEENSTNKPFLI